MVSMQELLRLAASEKASDLHINAGLPISLRIDGKLLLTQSFAPLTANDVAQLLAEIAAAEDLQLFEARGEIDFAYAIAGCARFRLNAFRRCGVISIVARVIREAIPTLSELGLPEVLKKMTRKRNGLIIATGAAGSGKSTTVAAMIDAVNQERCAHIITLEDPIEYLHRNKCSIVNQREIKRDTESFNSGLRAALREDPDIIMIGEMRDPETIATVITAAETGHLVFATLHTASASQAIDRIIDAFAPHQQRQIRLQLSMTLQGVIAQRLLPCQNGGRVAALEILVSTPAVKNLIREGKTHQLASVIQTGGKMQMQSLEAALCELYRRQLVSHSEIMAEADDAEFLVQMLGSEL